MLDLSALRAAFNDLDSIAFLSESGQKYVFRAQKKERDVVLKVFKIGHQEQVRIDREIEAVATLNCDYVPAVLNSGHRTIANKAWPFLLEEFVEGKGYREVLCENPVQSLPDVLVVADALLRACRDFEERQLVHRDIKPDNLIIDDNRKIWVIDFGIVRLLELTSATGTQQKFGLFTPGYGAPEQVRNLKPRIDSRSDLFSIGVVLYEALNGSNPYLEDKENALEIIQDVCNRDLPRLSIPGDNEGRVAEFLSALTARFPSRRPPRAVDALSWLGEITTSLDL